MHSAGGLLRYSLALAVVGGLFGTLMGQTTEKTASSAVKAKATSVEKGSVNRLRIALAREPVIPNKAVKVEKKEPIDVDAIDLRSEEAVVNAVMQQVQETKTPDPVIVPEKEDGKESIQSAKQPASPIRRIPELTAPNTSLSGIGTGNVPPSALQGYPIEEVGLPVGESRDGDWTDLCACWQAANTCHLPLYFEEPMLERNGQQRYPCLQPMLSGVRFFGNVAMLPYYMQLNPPWEEQSTLGSYRPGTSAPALYHRPPFRADAVTAEGLATAAILIAVP